MQPQAKAELNLVPGQVARHLATLTAASDHPRQGARTMLEKESSGDFAKQGVNAFGVYLGPLSKNLTEPEKSLLSKYDVLILNPLADGVRDAAATTASLHPSRRLLARLDVSAAKDPKQASKIDQEIKCLELFSNVLALCLKNSQGADLQSPFSGILLSGFRQYFQPGVINSLAHWMHRLGLEIWLELSPPDYLADQEIRGIEMSRIRGLVYRDATIRRDGDRKDFIQMESLRRTMRAVAAQRAIPGPVMALWETVDDDQVFDYAVTTRTYNWTSYNSAQCWIGHGNALMHPEAAICDTEVVASKPLGALRWLKDGQNMKVHEIWRANEQVSKSPCGNCEIFDTLDDLVPGLANKLQLFPPEARTDQEQLVMRNGKATSSRPAHLHDHGFDIAAPLRSQNDISPSMMSGIDKLPMLAPLSTAVSGDDFTGLGCFQLGQVATFADFAELRQSQRRLRDLALLQRLPVDELVKIRAPLAKMVKARDASGESILSTSTGQAIRDLVDLLGSAIRNDQDADDSPSGQLQVYTGLHSGFQGSSRMQFWGLYDVDIEGTAVLYLSNRTEKHRASVLLHTYLSSRQCTRTECFAAEINLALGTGQMDHTWQLPSRLVEDIVNLSPAETLLLLQRLAEAEVESSGEDNINPDFGVEEIKEEYRSLLLRPIRRCCEYQLLQVPTLTQQREMAAVGYLGGQITVPKLITSRLSWLDRKGCWTPDPAAAQAVFKAVDDRVLEILMMRQNDLLARISNVLEHFFLAEPSRGDRVDAAADVFALAVFSAFRRYSLDEIYLEILDRNVYPNQMPDQAGCFAEYFALGSRCESYFDMTPRALGRILADRYRIYYTENQPPRRDPNILEPPTTYAAMQTDLDMSEGREQLGVSYQITFFGVFAVPALIDISLLTTIGRGLYLTTFMSTADKRLATTALMVALLISGTFGSWIGTGGCYYFNANAFPAMSLFVLTRFVAGLALTIIIGIIGFVVVLVVENSATRAVVFLAYFVILACYMLTLNSLAIYQLPGSKFLSGRTVILSCIPILLISPIVSTFTNHDITVYLSVLAAFLTILMLSARRLISQWSSWYLHIPTVTDSEVIEWFGNNPTNLDMEYSITARMAGVSRNQLMPRAQRRLFTSVIAEYNRPFWKFWQRKTDDHLVKRLADGYAASMFLMRWYCRYKHAYMPLPYSSTWNLTLNVGIQNITSMQKGLRLHSAFLHWRSTGQDIWAGFLYFIVILLDKWAALLTGGEVVGLSGGSSPAFRLAVGFGLCYYLIGAISLDIITQPLWAAANEPSDKPVASVKNLAEVEKSDRRQRRSIYWRRLAQFFLFHIWGAAVVSAILWSFQDSRDQSIVFLGYIGAYWGLLWYQYNKIFCGQKTAAPLAAGAVLGLGFGLTMHILMPGYGFTGVISLGIACWTACGHSAVVAGMARWPGLLSRPQDITFRKHGRIDDDDDSVLETDGKAGVVYAASMLEPQPNLSQTTLSKIFDSTCALPADKRQLVGPDEQANLACITHLLHTDKHAKHLKLVRDAFPTAATILKTVLDNWVSGSTVVEVVSAQDFASQQEHNKIRAIARRTPPMRSAAGQLRLFVVLSEVDVQAFRRHNEGGGPVITRNFQGSNGSRHWRNVAESMVSATCELVLGMSHNHATLAEMLVVRPVSVINDGSRTDNVLSVSSSTAFTTLAHISEGIRRRLESSPTERARVIEDGDYTVLRYVLLGLDSETEWDSLPHRVRASLLKRSCAFLPLSSSHGRSLQTIVPLSQAEKDWLRSRLSHDKKHPTDTYLEIHLARCRLGASLYMAIVSLSRGLDASYGSEDEAVEVGQTYDERLLTLSLENLPMTRRLARWPAAVCHRMKTCLKFAVLSLTADAEYQRELDFVVKDLPYFVQWPIIIFLNTVWSYCRFLQSIIVPFVLFHGHEGVAKLRTHIKGMTSIVERNRVTIESFAGPSTLFWRMREDGRLLVSQYSGNHGQEPQAVAASQSDSTGQNKFEKGGDVLAVATVSLVNKQLISINTYEAHDRLVLLEREEYEDGLLVNKYNYDHDGTDASKPGGKNTVSYQLPLQRSCIDGECKGEVVHYSNRGNITDGARTLMDGQQVTWKFHYRENATYADELLWAEYEFPQMSIKALWSMPPLKGHTRQLKHWLPFPTITEATFQSGENQWHASWSYEHKFHPDLTVTLNGELLETPPLMIVEDWYNVLQKSKGNGSFLFENPLFSFPSIQTSLISRWFGFNVRNFRIPTSIARTQLWKQWKNGTNLDAISACWLDEDLLRADSSMRPYWRYRDFGCVGAARKYLDNKADTIMARVDVDPQTSSWVHIAYKMSDLYSCGKGGESCINTRSPLAQLRDSQDERCHADQNHLSNKNEELHVLAMDTSTWPNDPGGVSACRRDMVNELKTIRWHILAESANDYGVPRFQIERNVQSLSLLPLWGLDFLNPAKGVLESRLDSAVVQRSYYTRTEDIVDNFLPILSSLVRLARTVNLTPQDVEEATRALVDLNTYFDSARNWNDVWQSRVVKEKWRLLWLSEDIDKSYNKTGRDSGILKASEWWHFERPSILNLDQGLDLWSRYLFIFSLTIPERIPDVFQASHHFVGATYGIVCKVKRQCTLHVWDHCISYREFSTFMSSAVSFDSSFVNTTLISFTHLTCVLLEHHADIILPCCDYFNPAWEVELGTAEGVLEHRRTFKRKIDPVVNGICNMDKFKPTEKIRTATPTVIMLSHVQYVKDIKNAILATDIIVNKWGFKDYRLQVYGDKERAAALATECQQLIEAKNLQDYCVLEGIGNPSIVLQDAWLFLNSSISEGLPLAMGEAALTGVPVVCTDVGASYCVVSDRGTDDYFSEVVPPNDPESLARAQINILALLGPWSTYAGDSDLTEVPILGHPMPSPQQVTSIQQRMYAKTDQRRALGMLGRQNVQRNFSAERYLLEHEQMLWLGKLRSPRVRHAFHQTSIARLQQENDVGLDKVMPSSTYPLSLRSASAFFASSSQIDVLKKPVQAHVAERRVSRLTPASWSSLSTVTADVPRSSSWWLASGASSVRDLLSMSGEVKDNGDQKQLPGRQRSEVVQDATMFGEVVY